MKKIVLFYFLLFAHAGSYAQFGGSHAGNRPPGGIGNPNNASLPPSGPNVIVYQNIKYGGMSRALGDGAFSSSNLGFLGNNGSSIYIPPGKVVTVRDTRGQMRTFSGSVSNLAQYGWGNKIASGVNCTGHFQTFRGSVINLAPYGGNDKVRSVEIRRF